MNNVTQTIAQEREQECRVESLARQLRLAPLDRANWLTVVVPALVPAFAGAGILIGESNQLWKNIMGGATLVASLLVVVHKALKCDDYQADVHRLRRSYDALAVRYRTVFDLKPADSEARLIALDESLAALKESGAANIPDCYRMDAQKILSHLVPSTTNA